jgi:hypothetical protein
MADLKALIKQGEGISVEFKEYRRTLNRDVIRPSARSSTVTEGPCCLGLVMQVK